MRRGENFVRMLGAVVALQVLFAIASLATDAGDPNQPAKQAGEDRWVPSLAITGGVTIQKQQGLADSVLFKDMSSSSELLRGFVNGNDLAVSPFVGGTLELMAPALPTPMRPRLFLSGEILPTFASDRDLALEGDPDCVRGPRPDAPCARDGGGAFPESAANGQGSSTTARVDTLVFGASLGLAFPLKVGKRQLRIKPSVGWIHYEVDAEALVVHADCDPPSQCTGVGGFLRETILTASKSRRFNGIGPGLDVEMDTGRYGPLGVSLFLGARAYAVLGDRTISFGTTESFTDQISDPVNVPPSATDVAVGRFEVEVDPWIFRAHVGIRFQWLGSRE